jgi:hypothetical protein
MLEYGDIGIKEGEDLYRIIRKYGSSPFLTTSPYRRCRVPSIANIPTKK